MEHTKEGMENDECTMHGKHGHGFHGCCGGWGGCGMHGHGGMGHIIIKIIVILLVFWAGVHVGEPRSFLRGGYMMGGYGGRYYDQNYDQYGPGMMYRVITGQSTTTPR